MKPASWLRVSHNLLEIDVNFGNHSSLSDMIGAKRKTSMEKERKSSKEEGRKLSTEQRKQSKEEKN